MLEEKYVSREEILLGPSLNKDTYGQDHILSLILV
jgi:hypothetical protein